MHLPESSIKMKKGTIFTALFRIMGIVVLVLGIRMVGEGIYNYIDEHHQKDWIPTTAYVTLSVQGDTRSDSFFREPGL